MHVGRLVAAFQRPLHSEAPTATSVVRRDPVQVTLGGVPVTQVNDTTCGAAVLLMVNATGDPILVEELDNHPERIGPRQISLHRAISARALGPFPWPRCFGSPPWTIAREATFRGVTYRPWAVDDRKASGRNILNAVWNATASGIPVPLYTGGNLRQGLDKAVPRHVVLAVPAHGEPVPGILRIFEPGEGLLHEVALADLVARSDRHRALGGWTHVVWAILPEPQPSRL